MYASRLSRKALRQGDIIYEVVYPKPTHQPLTVCRPTATSPKRRPLFEKVPALENAHSLVLPSDCKYCVVLSQCCELALHDDRLCKAQNVLLTPLQRLTEGRLKRDAERLERIRQNGLEHDASAYYFEAFQGESDPYLAEFSHIFSVPRRAYYWLIAGKVAQLSDTARVQFKLKLANYLGRATEEEEAAGLWPED